MSGGFKEGGASIPDRLLHKEEGPQMRRDI